VSGDGVQESFDLGPRVFTPRPSVVRFLGRDQWLAELESATKRWRDWRASEYERAGQRALTWEEGDALEGADDRIRRFVEIVRDGDDEPTNVQAVTPLPDDYWDVKPCTLPLPIPKWHADRADAQRDRWSKLNACGSQQVTTRCDCKGHKPVSTAIHCDHWRLCVHCRGRRKRKYQARFTLGRELILKRLHAYTNRRTRRREGRWSEKMITLTVPHSGSPSRDIAELRRAMPYLWRSLGRYFQRRGGDAWTHDDWRKVGFWRSLEATASDGGHAHYHVWLCCPFVPQRLLAHWWARALSPEYRAKLPREPLFVLPAHEKDREEFIIAAQGQTWLYAPVVDLRAADAEARGEIVKYLVKDMVGDPSEGQFIEPHVYASIYAALDGARAVATSIHWWCHVAEVGFCECCGTQLSRVIEPVPLDVASATGPPA
jgi:hypothetical protein